MTKIALNLLLSTQAKTACWFIGIYTLIIAVLLFVFSFVTIDDTSWLPMSIMYTPKVYLLVMGCVYPLIATELYVSRGLTRKQFFWAYTGAISIISVFLFIPILASILYVGSFSPLAALTHLLHLPLFFLAGWTSVVGFQLGKWHMAILGILCAIGIFHASTTLIRVYALPDLVAFGTVLFLLAGLLLILPRIISRIPFKG